MALTVDQRLEIAVAGTHQVPRYRYVRDQTLDRQPPPTSLAQIVLVLVETAEAQRDGRALASERALHPHLLQGVRVYVQVRGRVVIVVVLVGLGGRLDQPELRLGRARSTGAAASVPALRPHASAADYVAQGDRLDLARPVVLLPQAQALLRQFHPVVRVPLGRHVEDLLEDGARLNGTLLHASQLERLSSTIRDERKGQREVSRPRRPSLLSRPSATRTAPIPRCDRTADDR